MSEGELIKKIHKESGYISPYVEILKESLEEIINEAKAEFPNPDDYEDCVGEDDAWIFEGNRYKEDVIKWRKKWFGE